MKPGSAQPRVRAAELPAHKPEWNRVGVFSSGIRKIPHVQALLGTRELVYRPVRAQDLDAVVGWGQKPNTPVARRFAYDHGLPYWRAEDGFLRSVGLGVHGDPPLSMVLDDVGIYYDARRPSRLETILREEKLDDPQLLERSRRAIDAIVNHELSKYNDSTVAGLGLGPSSRKRVLVVDQTFADLSILCGYGSLQRFVDMLDCALRENPDAEILVKTHPDVLSGKKRGYLGEALRSPRIRVLTQSVNPIGLLKSIDHVYTMTSQLGFEALLCGKKVTCFGVPFYAGWDLTDDRGKTIARRGRARCIEEVFAAAYILYTRYIDPDSGEPCEIERVIDYLALQRREFSRNQGRLFCFGFRFWKHNYVRAYLRCPGNQVYFPRSAAHAEELGFDRSSRLVVWGQRASEEVSALARRHQVDIWRMEDGFLRSVGLGSDMTAPASLVVDRQGIYYDPTEPSELETLLQSAECSARQLAQARELREKILQSGVSKYNIGDATRSLAIDPGGRKVILVPGQVEDDASIRLGCRDVCTNAGLLEAVRAREPDAFIIFKPHPDVLSGNRTGQVPQSTALSWCDHIEEDASLSQCLAVAQAVHTMTSLVGFEALLRGLEVVVYGQPFYSGWGLTEDRHPVARRTRKRSLDELVACTYILYPRYLNRETHRFTTAAVTLDALRAERDRGGEALKVSWSRRQLRKARHILREVRHSA